MATPEMPACFMAPATVPHYEAAAQSTRTIEWSGVLWAVTYLSEHDGIGWRVQRCQARPIEGIQRYLHVGETGLLRVRIVEDWGHEIKVEVEGGGNKLPHRMLIARRAIMGLEQTPI